MAQFEVKGVADVLAALDVEADRVKRNGPAAVAAGAAAAIQALQAAAPVRSGTLQRSIKENTARRTWNATEVQPDGYYEDRPRPGSRRTRKKSSRYRRSSEYPVRTMTVTAIQEYGTSTRPAKRWWSTACDGAGDAVSQAMFDEIMKD